MNPDKPRPESRPFPKIFAVVTLFLLGLALAPAHAASDIMVTRAHGAASGMSSGVYLGASLGNASYEEANDSAAGFNVYGGFPINEILAVELGWASFGEASQGTDTARASALQIGLLGKLPVSVDLSLFGKVGLARWKFELDTSALSGSNEDIDVYFGAGADYHVSGRSAVRFSADFYSMKPTIANVPMNRESISLFSIGFLFKP